MKKVLTILLVSIFSLSILSACARQPSKERTASIMERYFHKYSKKYPDSLLGKNPVKSINILYTDEIHKNLLALYAIMELANGMPLQTRFTIHKKPLGWRALSWENMGIATGKPEK